MRRVGDLNLHGCNIPRRGNLIVVGQDVVQLDILEYMELFYNREKFNSIGL
ncbi:MAG: hypothetical protein HOK35_12910 [Cytophagia bacterium]|nr:hypothetical protein [Cytophagia bacterium]